MLPNLRGFDVNGTATALICRVRPESGLATSLWPTRSCLLESVQFVCIAVTFAFGEPFQRTFLYFFVLAARASTFVGSVLSWCNI